MKHGTNATYLKSSIHRESNTVREELWIFLTKAACKLV